MLEGNGILSLEGSKEGASVRADWLTGLDSLTGELRVPGVCREDHEGRN